ncbi:SAM-dependent methyltransferase [Vibrio porteresiae]|uniref:Cyclopropane-fatty-acyl-phospholipid synthase family protein n=1 Tax=Vibrio porteresiae DSM 19223 TaxID=1123496 RepID=A0ABZ0Q703_9VIBR|nr:cyclopropane-fatty-acyl-phospholipid synthase family protein [Vibrio porteresiae]WPC72207.1 cyclopropane-fatty-acyl-phospholipid synthase family protein [Vibrio porteresiae DSM 19223]
MLSSTSVALSKPLSSWQKGARRAILRGLSRLEYGQLTLVERFSESDPADQMTFGAGDGIRAEIVVSNPNFYWRILRGGSIGGAESYIENEWDSSDLTAVIELVAANQSWLDRIEAQTGLVKRLATKIGHWLNRNTVKQAKQNILAHYDLGNDLYQTFLDKEMLYSSGCYDSPTDTLEQAQINKMERLCQQLQLSSSDHVVEIGTGWGGMAIYMARHYGCKVTTTTISDAQYDYACQRVTEQGLGHLITVLKEDYRRLTGQFDKLVSIEMIEAVGQRYLPSYLRHCQALLKPGGIMALQAITIADQRVDYYAHNVDFIQKYIFPGGFLPSVTYLAQSLTKQTDFVIRQLHDFGLDYAATLKAWRARFEHALPQITALGYPPEFIRLWRFYFCYCEGGFMARSISVVHLTMTRPV